VHHVVPAGLNRSVQIDLIIDDSCRASTCLITLC